MSTLTFVRDIVSSVAWPVFAVVLIVLLRRELRILVPSLRRLSVGPAQAEFDSGLARARDLLEAQVVQDPSKLSEAPTLPDGAGGQPDPNKASEVGSPAGPVGGLGVVAEMAEVAPRSVILEAWLKVEAAASLLLQANELSRPDGRIRAGDLQRLADEGVIDPADIELFDDLRRLRNRAAHRQVFEITRGDAVEYALIANHLETRLLTGLESDQGAS